MPRKRRGRGEGSVYQEPDGRWTGVISFGYTPDGKRRRKKVHGVTKKEVLDKLRKLPGQQTAEPCRLTVGEYLARWLENTAREKVGPTSYLRYKQIIENQIAPYIGGVALVKLSALDVEDFYAEMKRKGVPPASRRQGALVLTNALRHAVRLKLIPSAPTAEVMKPKLTTREMSVLTDEQVKLFLDAARRSRHYALFALAVATGMRRGELLALHWSDVDFDAGLRRAGLPRLRFHDLRHTRATALLSRGLHIKAVSQRLGHSDVGITLRVYAHVLSTDDAKLARELQAMYA